MSKTGWIIFTLISVGVLVSLVFFSDNSSLDVSKVDINAVQEANDQNGNIADHVFGKVDSKVKIIEYADYQCPGCASIYPLIKSIREQYQDQMQFIFRNYPLTDSHANAKAAAGTAEAAGLQGKFWEMHGKIYETQFDWSELSISDRSVFFENLAKDLKLDITKFNSDLIGSTGPTSVSAKINYDFSLGQKANVEATPTFYLNGVKLEPTEYENEAKFKETINAALKKAGVEPPASNQ